MGPFTILNYWQLKNKLDTLFRANIEQYWGKRGHKFFLSPAPLVGDYTSQVDRMRRTVRGLRSTENRKTYARRKTHGWGIGTPLGNIHSHPSPGTI